MNFFKKRLNEIIVIGLSAVIFFYKFGWRLLDVTNIGWLFRIGFDNATEFISWEYYRASAWSFPVIGTMSGYDYPTVTGVGLTGAIPLLAIPLKVLSPWLPDEFQHFGWWFLACYLLQGWFAFKLLKSLVFDNDSLTDKIQSSTYFQFGLIIGSLFFVVAPPLLFRAAHMNLSAHFLILASFYIYFQPFTSKQKFQYHLILVIITALIHQYLSVMILGLAFATSNDLWQRKKVSFVGLMGFNLANLVATLIIFYLIGNFNIATEATQSVGFGKFSANLNTFFNSFNFTRFQPALKTSTDGQYEGFAYFGIGFFLIVITLVIYTFIHKFFLESFDKNADAKAASALEKPLLYPIWAVAVLFFIFSLSHIIGLNDKVVHQYIMGSGYQKLAFSLRASGRFVWVLYYLILAYGITGFLKMHLAHKWKNSLLTLFFTIQIIDIKPMLTAHTLDYSLYKGHINHAAWKPMMAECERVIMFPSFLWHYKTYGDFYDFAHLAVLNKKAINTGYFARSVWDLKWKWEKNLHQTLDNGTLGDESRSIFICRKEDIGRFDHLVKKGLVKAFIYEDYPIFVPVVLEKTIRYLIQLPDCQPFVFDTEGVVDFLKRHTEHLILTVAMDEASFKLCDEAKTYFKNMGSENIPQLGHYGSYLGIFYKNKLVFEKVDNKGAVQQSWKKGDTVKGFTLKKDLLMHSAGATWGRTSSIKIDGQEHSLNKIGLNFVALDDNFNVIEKVRFNTFDSCIRLK